MEQPCFLQIRFGEMEVLLERYSLGTLTEEDRYTALKKWHFTKRPDAPTMEDFFQLLEKIDWSEIPEDFKTAVLNELGRKQLK